MYVARDCHLCELARADLDRLRAELELEVEEVDITGVSELERAFREWVPVIEHEGERVSVHRVEPAALRALTRPRGG
jgi:glutaredoxin